jgi:hypothetical protein
MQNFGRRYKKVGVTYLRHYFRIFSGEFEYKRMFIRRLVRESTIITKGTLLHTRVVTKYYKVCRIKYG